MKYNKYNYKSYGKKHGKKITAKDKDHLKQLIEEEVKLNGVNCNLNHIDVSGVLDMSSLFYESAFNGDISQWDTSRVVNMLGMFQSSVFNGDISAWDVSKVQSMGFMFSKSEFDQCISEWNLSGVTSMDYMFAGSKFNKDISRWNVSNVRNMSGMFFNGVFNKSISNWKPMSLINKERMFKYSKLEQQAGLPYWANLNIEFLEQAIDAYQLQKHLNKNLACVPTKESAIKTAIKI